MFKMKCAYCGVEVSAAYEIKLWGKLNLHIKYSCEDYKLVKKRKKYVCSNKKGEKIPLEERVN